MSPIKNLSDIRRLPRLGKIHLGIKVEGQKATYPKATDYFVVPREVAEVYTDKPTELDIMFPTDNPGQFAQQWLRRYSMTQGLVCIGDGQVSRRKVDKATGAMASHETLTWVWKDELPCDPQSCPEYTAKRCRRVMNLQFLLPKVPGLGVWQIDTSSWNSIVNINSMIELLQGIVGRCSMIPLKLCLGPVEVSPPGIKKKTVYIMHINKDLTLEGVARLALLPPVKALIPEPEVEEPPEDLYPPEVLEEPGDEPGDFPEAPRGAPRTLATPVTPDPREPLRQEINRVLRQGMPSEAGLEQWWEQKNWGYRLTAAAFESGKPFSEAVTNEHLAIFL